MKGHRIRLIHQKLNSKGFFRPLVTTHSFKIQIPTKKSHSKISYKNASISTYSPKTELERFFPTPGGDIFVSHKNASISTYLPKTELERFFPTPGDYTFVQNSISYKKFPSKIAYKNALISTSSPKTEFERFFPTPGSDIFVSHKSA